MPRLSHSDVVRRFWAGVVDSSVAKDGQVPGYDAAWKSMSRDEHTLADDVLLECMKTARHAEDPEDTIAAAVIEFHRRRQNLPPSPPPCPPARAKFYSQLFAYLHGKKTTPTAAVLANWMENHTWEDPPPELRTWIERLRAWPEGQPYPPIPDEEALQGRFNDAVVSRWWVPGAIGTQGSKSGQFVKTVGNAIGAPDETWFRARGWKDPEDS